MNPDDMDPAEHRSVQRADEAEPITAAAPLPPPWLRAPAVSALSAIFVGILNQMRHEADVFKKASKIAQTYWYVFEKQVVKRFARDYNVWVPAEKEMWLAKVRSKVQAGRYPTAEHFLADIRQISDNAVAYNTPGHGKYGGSDVAALGKGLLEYVEAAVLARQEAIAAAESAAPMEIAPAAAVRAVAAAAAVADLPAFDLFADYEAEVAQLPAAPEALVSVEEIQPPVNDVYAMCDKCRKWRLVDV